MASLADVFDEAVRTRVDDASRREECCNTVASAIISVFTQNIGQYAADAISGASQATHSVLEVFYRMGPYSWCMAHPDKAQVSICTWPVPSANSACSKPCGGEYGGAGLVCPKHAAEHKACYEAAALPPASAMAADGSPSAAPKASAVAADGSPAAAPKAKKLAATTDGAPAAAKPKPKKPVDAATDGVPAAPKPKPKKPEVAVADGAPAAAKPKAKKTKAAATEPAVISPPAAEAPMKKRKRETVCVGDDDCCVILPEPAVDSAPAQLCMVEFSKGCLNHDPHRRGVAELLGRHPVFPEDTRITVCSACAKQSITDPAAGCVFVAQLIC